VEQWGGIAYSLAAMAAACPPGWRVEPITKVGADLSDEVFRFLTTLPNLGSLAGIRVTSRTTNRVELRYLDAAERTERLSGGVGGWASDELLPLVAGFDALYVNFISGFELDLPTASSLRRETAFPLYADLHSLFLGAPGSGPRTPRSLPQWREWFQAFDAVQLNETELSLLGLDTRQLPELSNQIREPRPAAVLVTRGPAAAVAVYRATLPELVRMDAGQAGDGFESLEVSPPRPILDADPTGCGDVWGAVVFAGLLAGLPLDAAMRRGHAAAAARLRVPRIEMLSAAVAADVGPSDIDA
jgi:sugar/nucleoside kinase (ribokinase family)